MKRGLKSPPFRSGPSSNLGLPKNSRLQCPPSASQCQSAEGSNPPPIDNPHYTAIPLFNILSEYRLNETQDKNKNKFMGESYFFI